jgi:O-Antigen ligase
MDGTFEVSGRPGGSGLATRAGAGIDVAALTARLGPLLAGWVVPFGLVFYLAMKGGGYDPLISDQVGIVVWWVVVLAALVGILPFSRLGAAGWVGFGVLAAFAAWTALGVTWSSSSEQSVAQIALVLTYLGVFVLSIAGRGAERLWRTAGAVATAIGVVAVLALLSRVHPSWFPSNDTASFIGPARSRLNYPLNYWNGLAALIAIGLPLALIFAMHARTLVMRALSAAVVPAMALTAFYTYSRGGALEIGVALVVLVALYPRRLAMVPTLAVAAAGSAILIDAGDQRNALANGLGTAHAHSQGNELLAIALVVCAGAALLQVAIGLAARYGIGPRPAISRATAGGAFAAAAVAAIVIAIAAGLPGFLSDKWDEFKNPTAVQPTSAQRFNSASGHGRYQWWKAAVHENGTDPLIGTGPGTFQNWWAQHGNIPGFVRNAHSLYFETLGEVGIVGLLLIMAFVLWPIIVGIRWALRFGGERRALLAGAVAACAAFVAAAGVDWVWQIPAIPVAFLLVAGAILTIAFTERTLGPDREPIAPRVGLVALGLGALVLIAIPLASTDKLRASQADVRAHDLAGALSNARTAANIEPYAATPRLQEALVLELQGNLGGAVAAAEEATNADANNWRPWMVLSRLEAERDHAAASVAAYKTAKSLDPRSPLFSG